jgi:hypothetical protein
MIPFNQNQKLKNYSANLKSQFGDFFNQNQ